MAGEVKRLGTAHVEAELGATRGEVSPPTIWLDAIGLGYGVLDRLRELQVPVSPFIASARTANRERFLNLRAEAWWAAREAFQRSEVDLDPDDRALAGQLASVRYSLTSSGAIQIAGKDTMRHSPDRADALVIAIYAKSQAAQAGRYARLADRIQREVARPQPSQTTEQWLAEVHVPFEQAEQPPREKILPDEVYRNSAGGRWEP